MALLWTAASDVTDRWVGDDPIGVENATIDVLLEDAEDTVLREFPDMATRVARAEGDDDTEGPSTPLRRVKKVIARMVIRHLRNPSGERTRMEVSGPFTENVTFGGSEPGTIYMTEQDKAELDDVQSGGAFTVDTTPPVPDYRNYDSGFWSTADTWSSW